MFPDEDCVWVLSFAPGSFHDVALDWYSGDSADVIAVYDGGSTASPLLAAMNNPIVSGSTVSPLYVRSSSHQLTVRHVTSLMPLKGPHWTLSTTKVASPAAFCPNATYNAVVGQLGLITAPYYSVDDPAHRYVYPPRLTWNTTIHAPPGYAVRLALTPFYFQVGDVLWVHDGPNAAAPVHTAFTFTNGFSCPTPVASFNSSSLHLRFISGPREKFMPGDPTRGTAPMAHAVLPSMDYIAIPSYPRSCNGLRPTIVTGAAINISDVPFIDGIYPGARLDDQALDGSLCEWIYDAGPGKLASFHLVSGMFTGTSLFITDNGTVPTPLVAYPWDSSHGFTDYTAVGRYLRLSRRRDADSFSEGFTVTFSAVSPPTLCVNHTAPFNTSGVFTVAAGAPVWWVGVPRGFVCSVQIDVAPGFVAMVKNTLIICPTEVMFANRPNVKDAVLRVYDTTVGTHPLIRTFTHSELQYGDFRFSSTSMILEFATPDGWSVPFSIEYEIMSDVVPSQTLTAMGDFWFPSSNIPWTLPANTNINILLTCAGGSFVSIRPGHRQFFRQGTDYLKIYNGSTAAAPVFDVFETSDNEIYPSSIYYTPYLPNNNILVEIHTGPGNPRGAWLELQYDCTAAAGLAPVQPCASVAPAGAGFVLPVPLPPSSVCGYLFSVAPDHGWLVRRLGSANPLETTVAIYNGSSPAPSNFYMMLSDLVVHEERLIRGPMFWQVTTGHFPDGDSNNIDVSGVDLATFDSLNPACPCYDGEFVFFGTAYCQAYTMGATGFGITPDYQCEHRYRVAEPDLGLIIEMQILDWGITEATGSYVLLMDEDTVLANITSPQAAPSAYYTFKSTARLIFYGSPNAIPQPGPAYTVQVCDYLSALSCDDGAVAVVDYIAGDSVAMRTNSMNFIGPANTKCSLLGLASPGSILLPLPSGSAGLISAPNFVVIHDGDSTTAPVLYNSSGLTTDLHSANLPATTGSSVYVEYHMITKKEFMQVWYASQPAPTGGCTDRTLDPYSTSDSFYVAYPPPGKRCNYTIPAIGAYEQLSYGIRASLGAGDQLDIYSGGMWLETIVGPLQLPGDPFSNLRNTIEWADLQVIFTAGSTRSAVVQVVVDKEMIGTAVPLVHRQPDEIHCPSGAEGLNITNEGRRCTHIPYITSVSMYQDLGSHPCNFSLPNLRVTCAAQFRSAYVGPYGFSFPNLTYVGIFRIHMNPSGAVSEIYLPELEVAHQMIVEYCKPNEILLPSLKFVDLVNWQSIPTVTTIFAPYMRSNTLILQGAAGLTSLTLPVLGLSTTLADVSITGLPLIVPAGGALSGNAGCDVPSPNITCLGDCFLQINAASILTRIDAPNAIRFSINMQDLGHPVVLNIPRVVLSSGINAGGLQVNAPNLFAATSTGSAAIGLTGATSSLYAPNLTYAYPNIALHHLSQITLLLPKLRVAPRVLLDSNSNLQVIDLCSLTDFLSFCVLGSPALSCHDLIASYGHSPLTFFMTVSPFNCNTTVNDTATMCSLVHPPPPPAPPPALTPPAAPTSAPPACPPLAPPPATAPSSPLLPPSPPSVLPPLSPPAIVVCLDPGAPLNGSRNMLSAINFPLGTVMTFTCDAGFTLVGVTQITCTSSGAWSNQVPSCVVIRGAVAAITIDGILPAIVALQTAVTITVSGSNWNYPLQSVLSNGAPVAEYTLASDGSVVSQSTATRRPLGVAQITIDVPPRAEAGYYSLDVTDGLGLYASDASSLYFTNDCPMPGTYGIGTDCHPCPEGGFCPGGNRIWPLVGWWNEGENAGYVAPCPEPPSRCQGGRASACETGYQGPLCGACQSGYFVQGTECVECPPEWETTLLFIVAAVFYIAIAAAFCVLSDQRIDVIVTVIRMLQLIRAGTVQTGARLPPGLKETLYYLSISTFDFSFVKPACGFLGSSSYDTLFWGNAVMIACLVVPTHIALFVLSKVGKPRADFYKNRMYRAATIQVSLLYLTVATRTIEAVTCVNVGGSFRLLANTSIECRATGFLIVGAFGLLLFTVCTPLALTAFVHRLIKRKLHEEPNTISRFGFLYSTLRVEKNMHGYISAPYIHLLLSAVAWSGMKQGVGPYILVLCSFGLILLVSLVLRPFRLPFDNSLAIGSYSLGFASLLLSFLSLSTIDSPIGLAYGLCALVAVVGIVVAVAVLARGRRNTQVFPKMLPEKSVTMVLTNLREQASLDDSKDSSPLETDDQ